MSDLKVDGVIGTPAPPADQWEVTDSEGRKLYIRRLSLLEQLDLTAAAGELAENTRWFAIVSAAACIRRIDDWEVLPFNTQREIRAHVNRVRDSGLRAALEAMGGFAETAQGSATDQTANPDGSTSAIVKN